MKLKQKDPEKVFVDFQKETKLSDEHIEAFEKYADLLMTSNEDFNLTAIRDLSGIMRQHFQDSISLAQATDLMKIKSIADIGTGAGFPALPLKILYPHLTVYLIEVTKKKQNFLLEVVKLLGLTDVHIVDADWRTFLRTTKYDIDMFITRAALDEVELIRMFQPSCFYKDRELVYWVTDLWEPHKKAIPFLTRCFEYKLAKKSRQLAFFKAP
jgi:16S rRNA (guanine(527)-N(7))-methyltransferase RsmG